MNVNEDIQSLEELLDRIGEAANAEEQVTLSAVMEAIGRRSFGPLLLLAGLITLAPIVGDIPGMPTIMGLLVLLTAGQLLFRRKHFWIPSWLLKKSVNRDKLRKPLMWLRRPGRFIDRFTRSRLTALIQNGGIYFVAIACLFIAVAMPIMEIVPFSANMAGVALSIFGLALIAHDGVLALIAFVFTAATIGLVIFYLF